MEILSTTITMSNNKYFKNIYYTAVKIKQTGDLGKDSAAFIDLTLTRL